MKKDEIIDMARQAGLDPDLSNYTDAFEAFAKLVAEKASEREREACAKVWDDINAVYNKPEDAAERVASQWCAERIRARGEA